MITQINLKNFKCFEDEIINLGNLNILAGLNGMGKSTVLQALLLLRQNHILELLSKEGVYLNGSLVQLGTGKDVLFQYSKSREIGIELESLENGSKSWCWHFTAEEDFLGIKEQSNNASIYKEELFSDNFHFLSAERLGPRPFYESSNYEVLNKGAIGNRGELAVNYLDRFDGGGVPIKAFKHPSVEGYALRDQINGWLGEIRPGTRLKTSSSNNMGLVELSYQFIAGGDVGNSFRPTNVGFGLSYLLPILVAVLTATPGTLILIENPEAHLHPAGQSKLGQLFSIAAQNGVQLIIETHSEHVINGIRVAARKKVVEPERVKLHFFTGDVVNGQYKNYIVSPELDSDGRIETWPEGFLDEWDKNLMELL